MPATAVLLDAVGAGAGAPSAVAREVGERWAVGGVYDVRSLSAVAEYVDIAAEDTGAGAAAMAAFSAIIGLFVSSSSESSDDDMV